MSIPSPDIVLYGGAFDPPHQGHLDCIRSVRRLFPDVHIDVLPSLSPVYAGGELKSPSLSFATRMELCRLAFVVDGGFGHVVISDREMHLPKPNFTLNLVDYYRKKNPLGRIGLLIGFDQFHVFDQWHEPVKLLSMCDLLVVNRDAGSLVPCVSDVIEHRLGLDMAWVAPEKCAAVKGDQMDKRGCFIHILADITTSVSSSQVRLLFARREEIPASWLTPSVEEKLRSLGSMG